MRYETVSHAVAERTSMPNWCDNKLRVSGKRNEVSRFVEQARGKGPYYKGGEEDSGEPQCLDFNQFVPVPTQVIEYSNSKPSCDAVGAIFGKPSMCCGYHFQLSHWGTKWNAYEPSVSRSKKGDAVYGFDTAWSPPERIVRVMSEQFPTLTFKLFYWEGGMGFKGHVEYKAGNELSNSHSDNYRGQRGG